MKELIDAHPNLFLICVIIGLITIFFSLSQLERWLEKWIPFHELITLRSGCTFMAKPCHTYKNGKVFKLKDRYIITDLDNKEIPCLELEMLETIKN